MTDRGRIVPVIAGHPSGVLLTAQLLMVLAFPFTHGSRTGNAPLSIGSMIIIGAAIWMVRRTPRLTRVATWLGMPAVARAVDATWPDSFSGVDRAPQGWFELLYLSFTTLTSVVLSDIAPVHAHARSVVMIEEVAGVSYVGLVISRLAGMTLRRSRD